MKYKSLILELAGCISTRLWSTRLGIRPGCTLGSRDLGAKGRSYTHHQVRGKAVEVQSIKRNLSDGDFKNAATMAISLLQDDLDCPYTFTKNYTQYCCDKCYTAFKAMNFASDPNPQDCLKLHSFHCVRLLRHFW